MNQPERIEPFKTAATQPPGRVEVPEGRPRVGYFCPQVPLEMIHAAGLAPVRLLRFDLSVTRAEAHLPAYCCHLVRGGLEAGMAGLLDGLAGVVFIHSCDSMQHLADLWPRAVSLPRHYVLQVPTRTETPTAEAYLQEVLAGFQAELGRWSGREITGADLSASLELYHRLRRELARLYALNRQAPGVLSPEDFLYLVLAAFRLDPQTWLDLAAPLLDELQEARPAADEAKRLFLAGNLGDDPALFRLLTTAGAVVADDDLCTGRRGFDFETPPAEEPLAALARAFLQRRPCPCRHSGQDPGPAFLDRVRQSGAQGVVFLLSKYCEPHFFDYPGLARRLKEAGLPHLVLETSRPGLNLEQVRVRLEAFLEMLEE